MKYLFLTAAVAALVLTACEGKKSLDGYPMDKPPPSAYGPPSVGARDSEPKEPVLDKVVVEELAEEVEGSTKELIEEAGEPIEGLIEEVGDLIEEIEESTEETPSADNEDSGEDHSENNSKQE